MEEERNLEPLVVVLDEVDLQEEEEEITSNSTTNETSYVTSMHKATSSSSSTLFNAYDHVSTAGKLSGHSNVLHPAQRSSRDICLIADVTCSPHPFQVHL